MMQGFQRWWKGLSQRRLRKSGDRRQIPRGGPRELLAYLRHIGSRVHGTRAFPHKSVVVTKELRVGSSLVLAPHPDDEAIGMGGVLASCLERGTPVSVVYLTDGGGAGRNRDQLVATRRAEAEALGQATNIEQVFWDFPDTQLSNDEPAVSLMTEILRRDRPTAVFLPSFFDHHFDHFATNAILVDALRALSDFDGLIYGYEVWDSIPFPNCVVDITAQFPQKTQLIGHYQTPLKAADFVQFCEYRNGLHYKLYVSGQRPNSGYAEAFQTLDSESFQECFHDFVEALRRCGSQLPLCLHDSKLST